MLRKKKKSKKKNNNNITCIYTVDSRRLTCKNNIIFVSIISSLEHPKLNKVPPKTQSRAITSPIRHMAAHKQVYSQNRCTNRHTHNMIPFADNHKPYSQYITFGNRLTSVRNLQHYVSAKRWTCCPLARANHLMLVVTCPKVIHQEYGSRSTMPFHKGMPITKYSDPKTPNAGTFLAIQASWTFPRRPFSDACLCPYQLNLLKSWLDAFELSGFKMHWKCSDQARPKTLDLVELPWFPNDPSLNYGESAVPVAANCVPQSLIPSSPVGTIRPERNANKKEWTYNTSCACSVTLPLRRVIMT